jgi:hypothetical protein
MLMTIYPIGFGGRRARWRGIFKFTQHVTEHRFENTLRCFTLPQYKQSDSGWGGQGRAHHLIKKFDKFQEVRFFTDKMRQQFRDALKPGGWLCIDESMFFVVGAGFETSRVENNQAEATPYRLGVQDDGVCGGWGTCRL